MAGPFTEIHNAYIACNAAANRIWQAHAANRIEDLRAEYEQRPLLLLPISNVKSQAVASGIKAGYSAETVEARFDKLLAALHGLLFWDEEPIPSDSTARFGERLAIAQYAWGPVRDIAAVAGVIFAEALDSVEGNATRSGADDQRERLRPSAPRMSVNLSCGTAILDGTNYDVNSVLALRWLKVLIDHPGELISGTELKKYDIELDGIRPDRLKKYLPERIQKLIKSATGKGSRICLT